MTDQQLLKQALEALGDLLDQTESPPDGNCSCHIAPPCADCVDYSGIRYAIKQANTAITAINEALAQPEQAIVKWAALIDENQRLRAELKFNTTQQQRTEQNFCPRCGKRTNDIHTCTPPQENT